MEKACTRFQDRLVSRLALTPEQVARLQPVFDHTSQQLRAIHSKALRNTDEVIRRAHEQIARELTPEQKAKLEVMEKERQQWLEHRLNDHPADGPSAPRTLPAPVGDPLLEQARRCLAETQDLIAMAEDARAECAATVAPVRAERG